MGHTWPEKLAEATRLLARVDPIGLIADGCPNDEYEAEAEELLKSRKPLTSEAVQRTFLRWFGAQISEHSAKQVADGVTEIRQR